MCCRCEDSPAAEGQAEQSASPLGGMAAPALLWDQREVEQLRWVIPESQSQPKLLLQSGTARGGSITVCHSQCTSVTVGTSLVFTPQGRSCPDSQTCWILARVTLDVDLSSQTG